MSVQSNVLNVQLLRRIQVIRGPVEKYLVAIKILRTHLSAGLRGYAGTSKPQS